MLQHLIYLRANLSNRPVHQLSIHSLGISVSDATGGNVIISFPIPIPAPLRRNHMHSDNTSNDFMRPFQDRDNISDDFMFHRKASV